MSSPMRVRPIQAELHFLPITTRLPLKFGPETVDSVTCARVRLTVEGPGGSRAQGWGETPLSVQWVWPSSAPYEERLQALKELACDLTREWASFNAAGHALEVGHEFVEGVLRSAWARANERRAPREPLPWLAALVVCSAFDLALHDAFGNACGAPIYQLYDRSHLRWGLDRYLEAVPGSGADFRGKYPADFLAARPAQRIPAWHLVGGKDAVSRDELTGTEPDDGYPVLLEDWIRTDGLMCLKVKLRGDDPAWDYSRIVNVGAVALAHGCRWLSLDFNCTVRDTAYVNDILDRLLADEPRTYALLLYVEQPFPHDLEALRLDVRSVGARKPLFLDESAHDWRMVRLGRELGWTGVALKTCKTQTGALLSLAWARAHGMTLMVQDLTNPMLAQVPHVLLAAYAGTIQGVETNAPQFYPQASLPEAAVHPGLYRRRLGCVDWSSVAGPGFGYRVEEIRRVLPAPAAQCG